MTQDKTPDKHHNCCPVTQCKASAARSRGCTAPAMLLLAVARIAYGLIRDTWFSHT
jgi:hypothetical protein